MGNKIKVKRITLVECAIERNYVKQGGIYQVIYEDTWKDGRGRYCIMSKDCPPHLVSKSDYEIVED